MTNNEMRGWIKNASYQDLVLKKRQAVKNAQFLIGEMGDLFNHTLAIRKAANKSVEIMHGWNLR
jgi:hypothetical protein